jgi:hypothetical protein
MTAHCDCSHPENRYACDERDWDHCDCLCHAIEELRDELRRLRERINALADEEDY